MNLSAFYEEETPDFLKENLSVEDNGEENTNVGDKATEKNHFFNDDFSPNQFMISDPIMKKTESISLKEIESDIDFSFIFEEASVEEMGSIDRLVPHEEENVADHVEENEVTIGSEPMEDFAVSSYDEGISQQETVSSDTKTVLDRLMSLTKEMNERLSVLEAREQALKKREEALALKEEAFAKKQVSLTEKEMLFDNGDSEIIIDEDNAKLINSILNPGDQEKR